MRLAFCAAIARFSCSAIAVPSIRPRPLFRSVSGTRAGPRGRRWSRGIRRRKRTRGAAISPRSSRWASTASRRGWIGRLPSPSAVAIGLTRSSSCSRSPTSVGLRVIVQIYTDAAPEWLGTRYPDSSFVTDQGARIGSQASPGYCLDHAGVRIRHDRHSSVRPRPRDASPVVLRGGRVERTARRQLGLVQYASRVLLLPAHPGAVSRLAETEILVA